MSYESPKKSLRENLIDGSLRTVGFSPFHTEHFILNIILPTDLGTGPHSQGPPRLTGRTFVDRTRMTPQFVSSSLVNASNMYLAGKDMGEVLSQYKVRLDVLDEYLKSADVSHYYAYYFGMELADGGRAQDDAG